eukprot:CAMPEP_0202074350 /NCGR_PEP_ID=MMETSP0964-20121228/3564_1 /ASSEMBLY_ACC=CAM_ASM_000500 /TAXON_ID=4773 /ORGANISM="Schizochytrium aggregatum, Strain ATCC28209" /LENGTH=584 /DNA_ID=CAMNT_0048641495 /DNA_START=15 /DNA_END=1766 /DNA_ORIENTATION=+
MAAPRRRDLFRRLPMDSAAAAEEGAAEADGIAASPEAAGPGAGAGGGTGSGQNSSLSHPSSSRLHAAQASGAAGSAAEVVEQDEAAEDGAGEPPVNSSGGEPSSKRDGSDGRSDLGSPRAKQDPCNQPPSGELDEVPPSPPGEPSRRVCPVADLAIDAPGNTRHLRRVLSDEATVVGSDEDEVSISEVGGLERSASELNLFWKEHDDWKQRVLSSDFSAHVGDPAQGQRSLLNPNPPIMFKVTCEALNGNTRRRYSDFEWLREVLLKRYVGMIIPELPEKRVMVTDDLLRARLRGLCRFMERVLMNPYFRQDASLHAFLTIESSGLWEGYKKTVSVFKPGSKLESAEENEGRMRWMQALDAYSLPVNQSAAISKVRAEVSVLEALLKNLAGSAERMISAADSYALAMQDFGQQLRPGDGSSARNALVLARASEPIRLVLGALGDTFAQWSSVSTCFPTILERQLVGPLRNELNIARELRRMFARRDALALTIDKHRRALIKYDAERRAFEEGNRVDRVLKAAEKVSHIEFALRNAQQELDFTTKGIFFTEMDLFVENKVASYRALGANLAGAFSEYLTALSDVW